MKNYEDMTKEELIKALEEGSSEENIKQSAYDKNTHHELETQKSEIQESKRELKESEDRFRAIFEQAAVGVALLHTKTGQFIRINQKYCDFVGYTMEEMLQKSFMDITYPEDIQTNVDKNLQFIEGNNKEFSFEKRYVHKDGKIIWGNLTISPLWKSGEKPETYFHIAIVEDITERKLAEDALRQEQQFSKSVLDSLPGIFYLYTYPEHKLVLWNKKHETIFGYTSEEMKDRFAMDWHLPEARDAVLKATEEVMEKGQSSVESFLVAKDGHQIPFFLTGVRFEAQSRLYYMGIGIDITERRQAEESLRESEEKLRAIFNIANIGISITDKNGRYVMFNNWWTDILGYDEEEMKSLTNLDITHPDDRENSRTCFLKIVEGTIDKYRIEKRFVRKDNSIFWGDLSVSAIKDKDNNIVNIIEMVTDITERKQIEDVLTFLAKSSSTAPGEGFFKSLARYLALNLGMDFVCIDRLEGDGLTAITVAVWCDGRFEDNVSYALKDTPCGNVVGKNVCCYPANVCQFFPLDKVLKDLRAESYTGVTLWSHTGQPIGLISVIGRHPLKNRPLTEAILKTVAVRTGGEMERLAAEEEQKKLQDQLARSQKMESVGRLAGGIAHNFNNMLAIILGSVELTLEEIDPKNPIIPNLETIRRTAKRSADLTRQLLAFASRQMVMPRVLDLNETVDRMLTMLRQLIGEEIDIVWKPAFTLEPIKMDPSQIDQILANLLINARDAIDGAGKVIIETNNYVFDEAYCVSHKDFIPGEYVMLSVKDNGRGMDSETLANIFEPFFTTKELYRGGGLGLASIYGIVRQNNGFIKVYSEPGTGTTFNIYLPRYKDKENPGGSSR